MNSRGFTLIELMSALLILSLLALMSFRGLGAVLDASDHVRQETEKWKRVAAFFSRFQRDVHLSAPLPLRGTSEHLEFGRFAATQVVDALRPVAYRLNESHEIELWLPPARYIALSGVAQFELRYLDSGLAWVDTWPRSERDSPLPQAVRLRIVLDSGEELVRMFALN